MMRRTSSLGAALAALACSSIAGVASADDVATIKTRMLQFQALSAPTVDFTDPAIKSAAASSIAQATKHAAAVAPKTQTCADGSVRKGTWPDLDYCDLGVGAAWQPLDHFSRLLVLAQAYRMPAPGSPHFGNAALRAKIEDALRVVSTFYTPAICKAQVSPPAGKPAMNWWHCEIGAPNSLAPTLLLMEGDVDAAVFADARTQLAGSDCPDLDWSTPPFLCNNKISLTGANLIDVATSRLFYALYAPAGADRAALLRKVQASVAYATDRDPATDEGIQDDAAFLQHGAQLYTGGYGDVFAGDLAHYLYYTGGTAFTLDQARLSRAVDFVADGVAWAKFDRYYDVSVVGRSVTRPGMAGGGALTAAMLLALTPSPRQAEIGASAKMLLAAFGSPGAQLGPFAAQVRALPGDAAWPSGHRDYPSADFFIHRRPGFYASIKMISTRSKSGELVNQEGKLGSRQSDGRLYLSLNGKEYFGGNVWPAMDWTRLPGITVEQKPTGTADASYGIGLREFVGGTGNGRNGVAAMDFAAIDFTTPVTARLTAKKSWFFFEESLVFLAADITSPSANPVETVVNQWPLSAATQPLALSDGSSATLPFDASVAGVSWAASDGVGYFFPGGATVRAKGASRSGDWSTLGISSGMVVQPFVTLSLEHGAKPTGKTAAYAIVPNADAAAMKTYAAAPPFEVVANDATRAVVHYRRAGTEALGVVLYAAGAASGGGLSVQSDQAAVAYVESTAGLTSVSAADPAQSGGTLTLRLAAGLRLREADPRVVVGAADGGTTLTLPRDGKTYRARFEAAGTDPDAGALGPADAPAPSSGCACRVGGAAPNGAGVVVGAIAFLSLAAVRARIRQRSRETR